MRDSVSAATAAQSAPDPLAFALVLCWSGSSKYARRLESAVALHLFVVVSSGKGLDSV